MSAASGESGREQPAEVRAVATLSVDARYAVSVHTGDHQLRTDEPHPDHSPMDGPTPVALALSALASCTAATLRMYAEHKAIALGEITVEITFTAPDQPLARHVAVSEAIDPAVRQRLGEIAAKTPVTLLIGQPHEIATTVDDATGP